MIHWRQLALEAIMAVPRGRDEPSGIEFHERAPDASLEQLRRVLGSIHLEGPVPPWDLFEDENWAEDADSLEVASRDFLAPDDAGD